MNFLDMIKNSVLERFDGSGEFTACNAVGSAYLRISKLVQPLLHRPIGKDERHFFQPLGGLIGRQGKGKRRIFRKRDVVHSHAGSIIDLPGGGGDAIISRLQAEGVAVLYR